MITASFVLKICDCGRLHWGLPSSLSPLPSLFAPFTPPPLNRLLFEQIQRTVDRQNLLPQISTWIPVERQLPTVQDANDQGQVIATLRSPCIPAETFVSSSVIFIGWEYVVQLKETFEAWTYAPPSYQEG